MDCSAAAYFILSAAAGGGDFQLGAVSHALDGECKLVGALALLAADLRSPRGREPSQFCRISSRCSFSEPLTASRPSIVLG